MNVARSDCRHKCGLRNDVIKSTENPISVKCSTSANGMPPSVGACQTSGYADGSQVSIIKTCKRCRKIRYTVVHSKSVPPSSWMNSGRQLRYGFREGNALHVAATLASAASKQYWMAIPASIMSIKNAPHAIAIADNIINHKSDRIPKEKGGSSRRRILIGSGAFSLWQTSALAGLPRRRPR